MAEAKIQDLKRSISSWSLSTFKKPKIINPLFKSRKISIFSGKNRDCEPNDASSNDGCNESDSQPNLILTDHNAVKSFNQSESKDSPSLSDELIINGVEQKLENHAYTDTASDRSQAFQEQASQFALERNDIAFIDDAEDVDDVETHIQDALNDESNYDSTYYRWYDASSTDYGASKPNSYYESKFYDAQEPEGGSFVSPAGDSYEDVDPNLQVEGLKGFEVDIDKNEGSDVNEKSGKLIRSSSEIQIQDEGKKKTKKFEIILNSKKASGGSTKVFSKLLRKGQPFVATNGSKKNPKLELPEKRCNQDQASAARKENIKKIFGIKGKRSVKPIIDSNEKSYKETDIYIASTPYALTNVSSCKIEERQESTESSDNCDDGILSASIDYCTDFPKENDIVPKNKITELIDEENKSGVRPPLETSGDNEQDNLNNILEKEGTTAENTSMNGNHSSIINKDDIVLIKSIEAIESLSPIETRCQINNEKTTEEHISELRTTKDASESNENIPRDTSKATASNSDQYSKLESQNTENKEAIENCDSNGILTGEKGEQELSINGKNEISSENTNSDIEKPDGSTKCIIEPKSTPSSNHLPKKENLNKSFDKNESDIDDPLEIENFKAEINKRANSSSYISRTFKSIKENIFPSVYYREKVNRKKRMRLNPFSRRSHSKKESKLKESQNQENNFRIEPTFEACADGVSQAVMNPFESDLMLNNTTDSDNFEGNADAKDATVADACLNKQSYKPLIVEGDFGSKTSFPEYENWKVQIGNSEIESSPAASEESLHSEISDHSIEERIDVHAKQVLAELAQHKEQSNITSIQLTEHMEEKQLSKSHFYTEFPKSEENRMQNDDTAANEKTMIEIKTNIELDEMHMTRDELIENDKITMENNIILQKEELESISIDDCTQSVESEPTSSRNIESKTLKESIDLPQSLVENSLYSETFRQNYLPSYDGQENTPENLSLCHNECIVTENPRNPNPNGLEVNEINQTNSTNYQEKLQDAPICPPPKKRPAPPKPTRKGKKITKEDCTQSQEFAKWKNFSQPNICLSSNDRHPKGEPFENIKIAPSIEKDANHSRDSGYGTSNNESSSPGEPIYWEINEPKTLPKPSPRRKKDKSDLSEIAPRPVSANVNRSFSSSFTTFLDVPEWIQQRPPIPSPRTRKQKSTLSLNTEMTHYSGSYHSQFNLSPSAWSEDDFYSGKAASISYGVTSRVDLPPTLPMRTKKPSLVSLPGSSIGAEKPQEPHELVHRRRRRRTAPVPPSPPIQRHQIRPYIQSEELLKEVLFSVVTLMGVDKRNSWCVSPTMDVEAQKMPSSGLAPRQVTLEQVMTHLQNVFQVSSSNIEDILKELKIKQIPDIFLNLRIEEANELRPKTIKGGTNPYVGVYLSSSPHSLRTTSEHETLSPKWRQDFKIKLFDLRKDILRLEVMHEYDHLVREDLKEVHDFGSVSRLFRTTNAKALKQGVKLLGKASIPICEIVEMGFDNWVPLHKDGLKDEVKPRGKLYIKGQIGAGVPVASQNETRKKFDGLLTNLAHHHMNLSKLEHEETMDLPYSGQLLPEALASLSQHAIILNINKSAQCLSWWLVGSHLPSSDMGWQLILLKKVQSYLTEGFYNIEEEEVLADSFASWSKLCVHKLRHLQTSFPSGSGVIARHQLTSLLKIAASLEKHSLTKKLLLQRGLSDLRGKIKETVLEHVELWWKTLTNFRGSIDLESQIKKMIHFLFETEIFLKTVACFYSPVLLKEAKIPFFREVFLMISKGIKECVLPLLLNIDMKYSGPLEFHREDPLDISVGPDMWQLYVNIRRIHSIGADLPPEVLGQNGLFNYHKWFEKGVLRWIELSKMKTYSMLCKAVEFDAFQPDDDYHNFSSSAADTIGIFNEVQIWWRRLDWPDEVNSGVFLAKILQDVCSCGTTYSELIKAKVDATYNRPTLLQEDFIISEQTCIGLNNIEKVRQELTFLPETFGVHELAQRIEAFPTGGDSAAKTFRTNIKEVIEDSSANMERKVTEFIDTVIEKRKDRLQVLVVRSFEEGNEIPLLNEVLDPSLQLLQQKLDKSNFKRLLSRLWDELIQIFERIIARNSEERRSSYFDIVYNILEATLKFFTPSNGVGLEREDAKMQRYLELIEHLELRRLPSEKLIEKYYQERFLEHSQPFNQQTAELVIKAYFTRIGKLKVEVIMAKDMILSNSEVQSISSKQSNMGSPSSHPVDSYVKMQLVPSVWFKDVAERKTKVSRKSDPAVYNQDEEFEFELSNTDNGVANGFLLLTLKDYNLARGNKFIGESALPLKDLDCVDSADVATVSLTRLKMTSPGLEIGYKSLAVLRLRTNDGIAKTFVKKVTKRIPDSGKKFGFLTHGSSDEEKPKSRSPGILHRRKIS